MAKIQNYSDIVFSFDNDKIYDSLNSVKIKYNYSSQPNQNSLTKIFNLK